ncbi:hypothetical protein [Sunxiuqinia elliptica]|uniref:Uncharacterized protein n=1 Tax=Sunxiuqinia elliptica TaxID=655355 RepID=A0A4R6GU36_9BACT|nr:hypothetical protein [Sunxiuqinia elliptica]TDN98942.1 hypothetical protein DET52_10770 [Sunxiuqinia elliptica]TDO56383.1 hypothetical protein DET65_3934 [Sunxiuqinia elliptica]
MKTELLSFLLLLAVFSGCQKDADDFQPIQLQYAILNDKSSPVTNNQVTINFPDEAQTELIIFGGDGKYAISNSDNTKLRISSTDAYLKFTALKPGNVDVTINDSHNNFYVLKVQIKSQLRVKMNAKEKEGNIFGLMEFNLFSYSEEDFTLLDLTEAYDSLVWLCSNSNQRFKVLEHSGNSSNFIWQWSNCFFLPAKYETVLLGYKNGQLVTSDTVSVNIADNKDFLGYNWDDVVSTSTESTGYVNVFSDEYYFVTRENVTNNIPSISLFLSKNYIENEAAFFSKSKEILLGYINTSYSEPTYSNDENNSLFGIYNNLFKNRKEGVTPEYIWITSTSKISLLKKYDINNGFSKYEIYAEPTR